MNAYTEELYYLNLYADGYEMRDAELNVTGPWCSEDDAADDMAQVEENGRGWTYVRTIQMCDGVADTLDLSPLKEMQVASLASPTLQEESYA